MDKETQDFIEHFGVKGQKWGVRRDRSSSSGGSGGKEKKPSRKEKRQAKFEARAKRATNFVDKAMQDPDILISLNGRMVVTGREFTDYLMRGGLLDVDRTRIYAQQEKPGGQYVLRDRNDPD